MIPWIIVLVVLCTFFMFLVVGSRLLVQRPRALTPLWFKRKVQPAEMFDKKYYLVGYVEKLPPGAIESLTGVAVRDFSQLQEEAICLMAPVTHNNPERKWEVVADLARRASPMPILFTGRSHETDGDLRIGIDLRGCLGVLYAEDTDDDSASVLSDILQCVSNLHWRKARRKRYRQQGWSAQRIPKVITVQTTASQHGSPLVDRLVKRLQKYKGVTILDSLMTQKIDETDDLVVHIEGPDGKLHCIADYVYQLGSSGELGDLVDLIIGHREK